MKIPDFLLVAHFCAIPIFYCSYLISTEILFFVIKCLLLLWFISMQQYIREISHCVLCMPDCIQARRNWGCQGCTCTPYFLGQRNKIYLEFCLFAWLLSVVHPLILAACYGHVTIHYIVTKAYVGRM